MANSKGNKKATRKKVDEKKKSPTKKKGLYDFDVAESNSPKKKDINKARKKQSTKHEMVIGMKVTPNSEKDIEKLKKKNNKAAKKKNQEKIKNARNQVKANEKKKKEEQKAKEDKKRLEEEERKKREEALKKLKQKKREEALSEEEREKREKEKKKKQLKRRIFLGIVIGIIALIGIYFGLCHMPVFNIENIYVEGNSRIPTETILELSRTNKGDNLLAVWKLKVKNRIKENSYIDEVNVEKRLPNELVIKIKEKEINYSISYENGYAYIDKQGYLIDFNTNILEGAIVLSGEETKEEEIKENKRLNTNDLKKLNTVIKILEAAENANIKALISGINIKNNNDYIIEFASENKTAYLGRADNLATQMGIIVAILEKEKNSSGKIFVNMNLSTEEAYYREDV